MPQQKQNQDTKIDKEQQYTQKRDMNTRQVIKTEQRLNVESLTEGQGK